MGRELSLHIADFSGGWNCRDAPSQVADNESPDCYNVNFDERGGVVKRLGYIKLNDTPVASAPKRVFYWASGGTTIVQVGSTLYKTLDFITFSSLKVFSTSARVGMCDFQNYLIVVHPVDGAFTYDGTTFAIAPTGGSTAVGTCCATWQDKVWIGGDPVNKSRIYWSNAGDPTKYTVASDFVDVREQDGSPVVALGVGSGVNVVGTAGLLVFKNHSVHRIGNSTTGAFTTLSTMVGAAGPLAVTTSRSGLVCFLGSDGVFVTNGVDPPTLASRKIDPLFQPDQLAFNHLDNVCAAPFGDRVLFSMTRGSSSVNNFMLEYHPALGWFAPHNLGFSDLTEYSLNTSLVYGGDPSNGYIHNVFTGWSDNGANIRCRWQSKWFSPAQSIMCRYRRLLLESRGTFSLYVKFDYTQGSGQLFEIAGVDAGFTWNSDLWDDPQTTWGPSTYEVFSPVWSLGTGRAISVELVESSSASALAPKLLGDGASSQIGAVANYGLRFDLFQLGLA